MITMYENEFDNNYIANELYNELLQRRLTLTSEYDGCYIFKIKARALDLMYILIFKSNTTKSLASIKIPTTAKGIYSKDIIGLIYDKPNLKIPSILINIHDINKSPSDIIKENKYTLIHELTHMVQDLYKQDFNRKRYSTKPYNDFNRENFRHKIENYMRIYNNIKSTLDDERQIERITVILRNAMQSLIYSSDIDFIEYIVKQKQYINDIDEVYAHATAASRLFVDFGYKTLNDLYKIPEFVKLYLFTDTETFKSMIRFIYKSINDLNAYRRDYSENSTQALIEGYDVIFETTYKLTGFKAPVKTDIDPEDRTLKNLPRYSTGKSKIHFRDWLLIKKPSKFKSLKNFDYSWGMGENGKFYGWSHRAIGEFYPGKTVDPDTCGNIKPGKKWKIKSETEAAKQAIAFARSVS